MTTLINNFYVIHRAGKCFYNGNFHSEPLDQNLVMAYSSSVSNFCETLLGQELREVVGEEARIVFKQLGNFLFVVHAPLTTHQAVLQALLRDITEIFEFLFGSFENWTEEYLSVQGAQDILKYLIQSSLQDPGSVLSGIHYISLESEIIERLDKLLAFVESLEGVCGNGTMLILGESVLHSRFPHNETRLILSYHCARQMRACQIRYTPIYCNGSWLNLYSIRMQNYILVVMTVIDRPVSLLQKKLDEFRTSFVQSRLEIPTEEPPVLMRMFAKRETLALLYYNTKSGYSVFPRLRPGPEVQQKEILSTFWWMFSEACSVVTTSGVTSYSINRDHYRFVVRLEGIHQVYLLLAADLAMSESEDQLIADVLKNAIGRYETISKKL